MPPTVALRGREFNAARLKTFLYIMERRRRIADTTASGRGTWRMRMHTEGKTTGVTFTTYEKIP